MTQITATSRWIRDRDGASYDQAELCLEAHGHAEGDPEACAGVSAIFTALDEWRRTSLPAFHAGSGSGVLSPGDSWIRFSLGKHSNKDAGLSAFEMAVCGLLALEKSHPKAVAVRIIVSDVQPDGRETAREVTREGQAQ